MTTTQSSPTIARRANRRTSACTPGGTRCASESITKPPGQQPCRSPRRSTRVVPPNPERERAKAAAADWQSAVAYAAADADQIKEYFRYRGCPVITFLSAGSIGSEFVIVSLGLTCLIDRCL